MIFRIMGMFIITCLKLVNSPIWLEVNWGWLVNANIWVPMNCKWSFRSGLLPLPENIKVLSTLGNAVVGLS